MLDDTREYIIVDDLFPRYTIIVDILAGTTSAYCDTCEMWVFEADKELLSAHTQNELLEHIISTHDTQMHGVRVSFDDWTERFK
jgi:hypothetical protein